MKKVLITGKNSYIGTSVEKWLLKEPDKYQVATLDLMSPDWKSHNFSTYDTIFHVAGIAHIKETPKNRDLYFKVNRDLTLEVAKLAKDSKVNHFIFLSSMSVYGIDEGVITKSTKEQPKTAYGISKLEAESLLKSIESSDFKVAILRPPMVYGDGCKGNYNTLIHFAERFPFFPSIRNKRSMLFIDTLCEFVKDIINRNANGLFFPQNVEYSCTSNLVMDIAKKNGKTIMLLPFLNPLIRFLMICPGKIGIITKKAFGNLVYDSSMSK